MDGLRYVSTHGYNLYLRRFDTNQHISNVSSYRNWMDLYADSIDVDRVWADTRSSLLLCKKTKW